jgi:hypothetical protein
VALDWEFLFAWVALLAVVVAPVRLAVITLSLPEAVAWALLVGALAGTFVAADWLDRVGFERFGVVGGGPATFVAIQFLVVPTLALVVAPPSAAGPDGVVAALARPTAEASPQAWAAFVPAARPRVVRPTWLAAHLIALPVSVWLGLYGGLERRGVDPRRTPAFALALGAALALVLLAAPLLDTTPSPDGRWFWVAVLVCEAVAAAVAYGPTPAALGGE